MQTACIEFARNVCGLADANSSEFDPATPHRVIYKLRELTRRRRAGRHHAPGRMAVQARAGHHGLQGLRHRRKSASVTVTVTNSIASMKQLLTGSGLAHHRIHARRHVRRDRRDPRPSLLPRLPVPSRVQVQAARAASAVQGVHRALRTRHGLKRRAEKRVGSSRDVSPARESGRKNNREGTGLRTRDRASIRDQRFHAVILRV